MITTKHTWIGHTLSFVTYNSQVELDLLFMLFLSTVLLEGLMTTHTGSGRYPFGA